MSQKYDPMPTQRKRIGFLPRQEIKNIIDQICKHNKLSQSKVTGILVEEALSSRGVLKSSLNSVKNSSILITNDILINKSCYEDNDDDYLNESFSKDEVNMINDFIEFKIFKKVMNQNKKII